MVFVQLLKSLTDLRLKKSAINNIKDIFNNSAGWNENPNISIQRLAEKSPLGINGLKNTKANKPMLIR